MYDIMCPKSNRLWSLPLTMAAAIKMDELLVLWLGSDTVYENVQKLIESYRVSTDPSTSVSKEEDDERTAESPRGVIPPFYPKDSQQKRRRWASTQPQERWLPDADKKPTESPSEGAPSCARDQVSSIMVELGLDALKVENFSRITKEVFHLPSFFSGPLFRRITSLWNEESGTEVDMLSLDMLSWFWINEMEPYDESTRFFRLVKQPGNDCIFRDDFLPYIKELLSEHPVREFCTIGTMSILDANGWGRVSSFFQITQSSRKSMR